MAGLTWSGLVETREMLERQSAHDLEGAEVTVFFNNGKEPLTGWAGACSTVGLLVDNTTEGDRFIPWLMVESVQIRQTARAVFDAPDDYT